MKINIKCSLLMAAYYSLHCVLLSYVTYYLGTLGISDLFISIVVAGACALGGVMQIVAGRITDRSRNWNWKKILILFSAFELVIALVRIPIHATTWQWIMYGLIIVVQLLMMPMVNLASFDYSSRGMHVNFGMVRGVGSAAFAAASYIVGKLTGYFGSESVLVITAILAGVLLLSVLIMPEPGEKDTKEKESSESDAKNRIGFMSFIKKYPVFFVMVIGQVFIFLFHNMINTFFIRVVENVGGGSKELGIALAIAAMAELPILFLYSRINSVIKSSKKLLVISCCFFVLRAALYLVAPNVTMIYLVQFLQSVSYGLMIAAKATYADESMAAEDKATGQAMMTFTDAFGAVAGTFLGGLLLDLGGTGVMLTGGLIMAIAGTLVTVFAAMGKNKDTEVSLEG